jgi:hypothetical protein
MQAAGRVPAHRRAQMAAGRRVARAEARLQVRLRADPRGPAGPRQVDRVRRHRRRVDDGHAVLPRRQGGHGERSAACGSSRSPSSTRSTRPRARRRSRSSRAPRTAFRLPYAKRSTTFKRTQRFGATTNENEYFRDPTGNRRYWPVHCSRKGYDKAKLAAVRDQLLAEAVAAHSRRRADLADAGRGKAHARAAAHPRDPRPVGRQDRAMARRAGGRDGQNPITRERILTECLKVEISRVDERSMATRVGKAMHRSAMSKDEDKNIPERFFYTKRQSSDEGDEG